MAAAPMQSLRGETDGAGRRKKAWYFPASFMMLGNARRAICPADPSRRLTHDGAAFQLVCTARDAPQAVVKLVNLLVIE